MWALLMGIMWCGRLGTGAQGLVPYTWFDWDASKLVFHLASMCIF